MSRFRFAVLSVILWYVTLLAYGLLQMSTSAGMAFFLVWFLGLAASATFCTIRVFVDA